MSARGQGQCLVFVQGHSDLYFQTSTAKPLGPLLMYGKMLKQIL